MPNWDILFPLTNASVVALVLGVSYLAHRRLLRTRAQGLPRRTWVVLALCLALGVVASESLAAGTRERFRNLLRGLAPTYALELERAGHDRITPQTRSDDPLYLALIERQRAWLAANPTVADVYTMRRLEDGGVALVVDSETDYDGDGAYLDEREQRTPLYERYPNVSPTLLRAFGGENVFDDDPNPGDRWGTWVSGYAPVRAPDGRVDAIVGVDLPAAKYFERLLTQRLTGLAVGAVLCMIVLFSGALAATHRAAARRHAEYEAELRASNEAAENARRTAEREAAEKGELAERAQAADRAKSEFLAVMSHEIRTPLNGVTAVTDLLSRSRLDDEQRAHVRLLDESVRGLRRILDDILDSARLAEGRLELVAVPFDLAETVRAAAALYEPQAAQKGVRITHEVAADVPQRTVGDAVRVRQVLVNLISNAVKFTDRGTIDVRVRRDDAVPDGVRFTVSDTGVGIDPSRQVRLFERFFQADQTPTRAVGGSGLGLSICRDLVRRMGGTIDVASEPGRGSTFGFVLPLPASAAAPPPAASPSILPDAVRGRRVLVVDDDTMNRKLMRLLLESAGCAVETADSGEAAVARVAGAGAAGGTPFDAVMMDYRMSPMDGAETTRRLRDAEAAGGRRTPVVALTGDAMHDTRELCAAAGMDDFVVKPVDRQALVEALARVLGPRRPAG